MMKKLPILIILSFLFLAIASKSYASTAFTLSSDNTSISVSAHSQSPNNTYRVTIDANGPITFNTNAISFNSGVCYLGSPHSFVFSSGGSAVSGPVTVICSTASQTTTLGGLLFTIPASIASGSSASLTIDASSNNTNAVDIGVYDAISSYGSTVGFNGVANNPTVTATTPTPTRTTLTATPKSSATALNVAGPGSLQAKITPKPTITSAIQPSYVVITQPPIKFTPLPTVLQQVQPTTNSSMQTLIQGYFNNAAAALLFVLPILVLLIMVGFLSVRVYQINRRRQREIELLFEHEMGELAALESKMDLINEKGDKGKIEFKQEFQRTKDQILKEIHPDYIGSTATTPA